MNQRDDVSGGDAGTDEEFVDRSMPQESAASDTDGTKWKAAERGKRSQPPAPKRGPRDPKPKENKPGPDTEHPAGTAAKTAAKRDVTPEQAPDHGPQTTNPEAPKKQPEPKAKRMAGSHKPERPAKPPRKKRARAPRAPGGYPEFHAPVRARKDGKPAQTIVFLHGGNVGNWSWDPQVRAFGDYEVLTPDLPGFGAR
ncbi:MAG: hypothetical protein Q4P23_14045, partial [Micrococcaceae bacterium]|nr:hypothetical protein [Micrococcaceae bacterium]